MEKEKEAVTPCTAGRAQPLLVSGQVCAAAPPSNAVSLGRQCSAQGACGAITAQMLMPTYPLTTRDEHLTSMHEFMSAAFLRGREGLFLFLAHGD